MDSVGWMLVFSVLVVSLQQPRPGLLVLVRPRLVSAGEKARLRFQYESQLDCGKGADRIRNPSSGEHAGHNPETRSRIAKR